MTLYSSSGRRPGHLPRVEARDTFPAYQPHRESGRCKNAVTQDSGLARGEAISGFYLQFAIAFMRGTDKYSKTCKYPPAKPVDTYNRTLSNHRLMHRFPEAC